MTLTPKLRQALKARAHKLKPVILVGSNGISEAVLKETDRALNDHELIKIKIPTDDRDLKKQLFAEVCEKLNAELVQQIGSIGVIYRKNED